MTSPCLGGPGGNMIRIARAFTLAVALTVSCGMIAPVLSPAYADTQSQTKRRKRKRPKHGLV